MVALGLLLSTVGVDLISGAERFTFEVSYLRDGFNIAILAMGLFGMSEVLMLIQQKEAHEATRMPSYRLRDLLPNRKDWKASGGPIARGTVLGFSWGFCRAAVRSSPALRVTSWRRNSPAHLSGSAKGDRRCRGTRKC